MQNQLAPKTLFFSPNYSNWSRCPLHCVTFSIYSCCCFFLPDQTRKIRGPISRTFPEDPSSPLNMYRKISGLFFTPNLGGSEPSRNKSPTRWSPPGRSAGRGRFSVEGGDTDVPAIKDLKLGSLCLSGRVRRKMQKEMRKVFFFVCLFSDSCVCTCDSVMSGWLKRTVLSCKEK